MRSMTSWISRKSRRKRTNARRSEQVALAEFLASQGIQAPAVAETAPAAWRIGPAQETSEADEALQPGRRV
jgi:hypothetical protein